MLRNFPKISMKYLKIIVIIIIIINITDFLLSMYLLSQSPVVSFKAYPVQHSSPCTLKIRRFRWYHLDQLIQRLTINGLKNTYPIHFKLSTVGIKFKETKSV